jgi:hypothetical protein
MSLRIWKVHLTLLSPLILIISIHNDTYRYVINIDFGIATWSDIAGGGLVVATFISMSQWQSQNILGNLHILQCYGIIFDGIHAKNAFEIMN